MFIAYYRVSTKQQGRSGLGLEAQRMAVSQYLGDQVPIRSYQDIESGANDARPQLRAALDLCRLTGATLLVAKLDRLSRNVAFLATLQDSGQRFVCADMPEANELTIHVMAAVAQAERKMISQRTSDALAAAKARGQRLGGDRGNLPSVSASGRLKSAAVRAAAARDRLAALAPHIAGAREAGHVTHQGLADYLNGLHIQTARGGRWSAESVRRLV